MKADKGRERSNADEASRSTRDHWLGEYLIRANGAGEVGIDDALPVLVGHLDRRDSLVDPGAIDHHVDLPERFQDGVGCRGQRPAIEDIGFDSQCASPLRLYLSSDLFNERRPTGRGHDMRSRIRQTKRQHPSDSARSANHDRDASIQTEKVFRHDSWAG
jgi:hypothetical protein